nr:translation initiation factor IF-2-like [Chlorocebus sabaeus]
MLGKKTTTEGMAVRRGRRPPGPQPRQGAPSPGARAGIRSPLALPGLPRASHRPRSLQTDPATGNAPLPSRPRPRPPVLPPPSRGPGCRPRIPGLAWTPQPKGAARRAAPLPGPRRSPSNCGCCGAKANTKGRGALPATPLPARETLCAGSAKHPGTPEAPDAEERGPTKISRHLLGAAGAAESPQRQVPPAARWPSARPRPGQGSPRLFLSPAQPGPGVPEPSRAGGSGRGGPDLLPRGARAAPSTYLRRAALPAGLRRAR